MRWGAKITGLALFPAQNERRYGSIIVVARPSTLGPSEHTIEAHARKTLNCGGIDEERSFYCYIAAVLVRVFVNCPMAPVLFTYDRTAMQLDIAVKFKD